MMAVFALKEKVVQKYCILLIKVVSLVYVEQELIKSTDLTNVEIKCGVRMSMICISLIS